MGPEGSELVMHGKNLNGKKFLLWMLTLLASSLASQV